VPSFFLTGIARSLFIPLSLAVGFAMLASYLLANTLVPVLSTWLLLEQRVADHAKIASPECRIGTDSAFRGR